MRLWRAKMFAILEPFSLANNFKSGSDYEQIRKK